MAFWSSCWWACLCVLWLTVASAPPRYILRTTLATFSDALSNCSPGVLTTLATQQEVSQILRLVLVHTAPQENFTFWVGLRKNNSECVVPTLPLRGFRWTETGEWDSQVSRWVEEPPETCSEIRCAALTGRSDGSKVIQWGLISVTCKNQYQYICKLKDGRSLETSTPAAESYSRPAPAKPKPAAPDLKHPTLQPETALGPKPSSGSSPCADGFQRDSSGHCVDINECSSAVCRHTCLNTEGSYRCIDQTTPPLNDGTVKSNAALSAILVPALVAVAVLVVLVVVVVVTVKCCLVRRAKRRALRRAQKMAMKTKHEEISKETANEKAAT